jgi:ribonuclease HI
MNNTKPQIFLFTDGSVNPQSGVGFGAYLLLDTSDFLSSEIENKIVGKRFDNTSSTKLELETLLWAVNDADLKDCKVTIYTDCQNIIGLKERRDRFEKNDYITGKGKLIKNHELYKEFYKITDILDCELIKIKGHKKSSTKNNIDEIFTLVDKATRKALRKSSF